MLKLYLQRIQFDKGSRFIAEDAAQLDHLRHDVQTCTFLVRNSSGDYSFRHPSFLEFFVAQSLAEDLEKGVTLNLESSILPVTIRGFLLDFLKEAPANEVIITSLKNLPEGTLKENMIMLASLLKINLPKSEQAFEFTDQDALLSEFIKGNTKAFNKLFEKFYPRLLFFCKGLGVQDDVAQDIVSGAFLNIWLKKESIESINHIENFLFLKIKHGVWDSFRRKKAENNSLKQLKYLQPESQNEKGLHDKSLFSIEEAIKKLSEKQRLFIQLFSEGYSTSEIAEKMKITLKTVLNLKSVALKSLRRLINEGRN